MSAVAEPLPESDGGGREPELTEVAGSAATDGGAEERRQHAVFHELAVESIEPLTEDAVAVTFAVPPELAADYDFAHGQHLTIRMPAALGDLGDTERRNYSICAPAGSGRLRIGVKRLPGGVFSTYVAERLRPGDTLEVMTPTGRFFTDLDPAHAKHYVAIAAGSGITPILSILTTTLATEADSRFTLLYGNRSVKSIMFLEELEDLKNTYPGRFHLVNVLSREATDVELFSGRLDTDRLGRIFDLLLPVETVDEWFLCGPYAMVSDARKLLIARGANRRAIHAEVFFVGDIPPPPPPELPEGAVEETSTVTVVLDGRRTTFELAQHGGSVLDAVLQERTDAPFACKGGVCGTCRAKLVEGEVVMDQNWALEDEELERGYVLTCQSHPRTPTVLLDYDG